jgi:hypothetical protein
MSAKKEKDIPVLTDIVEDVIDERSEDAEDISDLAGSTIPDLETVIAELQTRIASSTYALTDELMRTAFAELEANVFRQISSRLRQQLPELIDAVIREHLTQHERNQDKDD